MGGRRDGEEEGWGGGGMGGEKVGREERRDAMATIEC